MDKYISPFGARYASDKMQNLFSERHRALVWRKLWVALARAEMQLGLPISAEQVAELEQNVDNIDLEVVKAREAVVRHDVMAHVYAYSLVAPNAAPILHLGATSCYVTDNGDLLIFRDALLLVRQGLVATVKNLAKFAEKYKDLPTVGYTHYQAAQPVTVGKRATLWMQDFCSDVREIDGVLADLKLLGCRGTTGTEASFVNLFDGDEAKIDQMNDAICKQFGFDGCFTVCGQTYPRKVDSRIAACLASVAESAAKMANDVRLLQHDRQIEEPFEKQQIGSSAMAYKRNPMRCERICSLSRYLVNLAANTRQTSSTQWLERTLDDSANRRLVMAEAFLCADSVLRLTANVTDGLVVNQKMIKKTLDEYMPFIATENLLMEAVKAGGDRQRLHEVIRSCSMVATQRIKDGEPCDLLQLLKESGEFSLDEQTLQSVMDASRYVGRSARQVERFLASVSDILAEETDEIQPITL